MFRRKSLQKLEKLICFPICPPAIPESLSVAAPIFTVQKRTILSKYQMGNGFGGVEESAEEAHLTISFLCAEWIFSQQQ